MLAPLRSRELNPESWEAKVRTKVISLGTLPEPSLRWVSERLLKFVEGGLNLSISSWYFYMLCCVSGVVLDGTYPAVGGGSRKDHRDGTGVGGGLY